MIFWPFLMYFYWIPNEAKSQFCDELPMPTNALVDRDTSGIVNFVVEILSKYKFLVEIRKKLLTF